MPIRRREGKMTEEEGNLLHPLLQRPVHFQVWSYIRDNPGCTRPEIKAKIYAPWQRVTELIDAGLVFEGERTKKGAKLFLAEGPATGIGRDTVYVVAGVYVNKYGEFSHVSDMLVSNTQMAAELPLTLPNDGSRLVAKRIVKIPVPRPKEGYQTRKQAGEGGIIDAEVEEVEEVSPLLQLTSNRVREDEVE